jgi:hypothetical protein
MLGLVPLDGEWGEVRSSELSCNLSQRELFTGQRDGHHSCSCHRRDNEASIALYTGRPA